MRLRLVCTCVAIVLGAALADARAGQSVTRPFVGVTHFAREESKPRPVRMHVIVIDLKAPGLRFIVTPQKGAEHTIKQTTLDFLLEHKAQIAVNAHFFEPWPPPNSDPGTATLVGLAASNGHVYSPFNANPPKPYAIRADAPALNIDPDNVASIVHRKPGDASGRSVAEAVKLWNAVSGNEQIVTAGRVTPGTGKWHNTPNPLTVIGLADGKLLLLVVDGRQTGVSEGLTVNEAAELLKRDYNVTDAINLDGGGSSTLCMSDPKPRVVNVPVGINNKPGTLRAVGSNLAIFARPSQDSANTAPAGM